MKSELNSLIDMHSRFLIFIQISHTIDVSYNQPKLPRCPRWDPHAITFANTTTLEMKADNVFVDRKNTIYVTSFYGEEIRILSADGNTPGTITASESSGFSTVFVALNGDIYVSNGYGSPKIEKYTRNTTQSITVMEGFSCYELFIDVENHLYCSVRMRHQVIKRSLNYNSSISVVVAGNGTRGRANNMLDEPLGIFVATNFDLYVADYNNRRVQLFKKGQSDGTTIVDDISTSTMLLHKPVAVFLDANDNLYIVDPMDHRIIRFSLNIIHCIVGCSRASESELVEIFSAKSAAFDNHGNIFVADYGSFRIQKFRLMTNTFGK